MVKVVDAVYADGVLRPEQQLDLRDQQRVRLIVQPIDGAGPVDRDAALARLRAGIAGMKLRLDGRLPTRDELHDRG